MRKKIANIISIANKCGFDAKYRDEAEKTVFAFRDKESALNCFFEVRAKNDENDEKFCENVAHSVFLLSENFDLHTETQKYLKKVGGNIKQYTEIYAQMATLSCKIRNLWYSL